MPAAALALLPRQRRRVAVGKPYRQDFDVLGKPIDRVQQRFFAAIEFFEPLGLLVEKVVQQQRRHDGVVGGVEPPPRDDDVGQFEFGEVVVEVLIAPLGPVRALELARRGAKVVLAARTVEPDSKLPGTIGETLAGVNNPAGRLPVTFYKGVDQLPPFEDYAMKGRTYRYFEGQPLYPFGHGLSYTRFEYSSLTLDRGSVSATGTVQVKVTVKNVGKRDGDEVVQLYVRDQISSVTRPVKELKGFRRVHLEPRETRTVTFDITPDFRVLAGIRVTHDFKSRTGGIWALWLTGLNLDISARGRAARQDLRL